MFFPNMRAYHLLFISAIIFSLSSCANKQSEKDEVVSDAGVVNQGRKTEKDADTKDINDFYDAALNGQMQVIKDILEWISNVDTIDENGHTALMLAAYNGHTDIVKLLLERGADVDRRDPEGRSPLMFAASGPFAETVKVLLEHKANVNMADNGEHFTPLMYAAAEGHTDVVKVLLDHGADASLKDVDGDTAASFARKNGHTKVIELIKQYGK